MPINLNNVQRTYVNEVARPMIERLIKFRYELDAFVLDTDNMQNPIANIADVLNDAEGGTSPRADAPTLQGNQITQLRNFAANMRDQINAATLNTLVSLSVRSVQDILRNNG